MIALPFQIDYLKGLLQMKKRGINANDVHLKLMKLQEENEKLKNQSMNVMEFEKLIRENRQMKLEIQRMH